MSTCSICLNIISDNIKLSCTHEFCKPCLKAWYDNGSKKSCPMCRQTFNGTSLLSPYEWMESILPSHSIKKTDRIIPDEDYMEYERQMLFGIVKA